MYRLSALSDRPESITHITLLNKQVDIRYNILQAFIPILGEETHRELNADKLNIKLFRGVLLKHRNFCFAIIKGKYLLLKSMLLGKVQEIRILWIFFINFVKLKIFKV